MDDDERMKAAIQSLRYFNGLEDLSGAEPGTRDHQKLLDLIELDEIAWGTREPD